MLPTIEEIEDAINISVYDWEGRCHEIASLIIESGLIEGKARYGMFNGEINPNSIFKTRSIARHGWIELEDESIVDPTRWVFECVDPYLYHGDDDEYDIGANDLKEVIHGTKSFPEFNSQDKVYKVPTNIAIELELIIGPSHKMLCKNQVFWLANCHPETLNYSANQMYNWIEEIGLKSFIPIDNWNLIME